MEKPSPPELRDCLAALPIRNLWVIARLNDVGCEHEVHKAELVEQLAGALLRREVVRRALRRLTPDERQALDALIAAGGRMAWSVFREQFGDIRPFRPWRDDAPPHPWRRPVSPAEALWFRGLIFRRPWQPRPGQDVQVLIPTDLLARLPSPPEPATPDPLENRRGREPALPGDVVTDVALFISLLYREDIRPLWGRWLPPRHLPALNERLSAPEELRQVRSELQSGRLRFLHFLAEAAGLVAPTSSSGPRQGGGWLKPTPQAWVWLDQPPAARFEVLWAAWRARSDGHQRLWEQYRLPGHATRVMPDILAVVLDRMAKLAVGAWYSASSFAAGLVESERALSSLPAGWRDDEPYDLGAEIVQELIHGPLAWWGVVHSTTLRHSSGSGSSDGAAVAQADAPIFALSTLGGWVLSGEGAGPPAVERPFRVDDGLTVCLPAGSGGRALVEIEAVAEWRGWIDGERCYRVTRDSLSRALSRSIAIVEVLETLSRGQAGGLGAVPSALVRAWADETAAVSLRRVAVLETRDAERLRRLSASRGISRYFRETLSPRAVVVDAGRVGHLVDALKRQGVWPRVDLPTGEPTGDPIGDAGAAAALWIAGQVYARLARWIALPQRIPAAVLDDLAAGMSEEAQAAARQTVEDVLDGLAVAMDGWAYHPMPEAGRPPEETLPAIERAIAEGQTLRMAYWTAGRGERSTRTVEPYRIEWRGDVAYLVGFCHERLDERVFRLDRIERLEVENG